MKKFIILIISFFLFGNAYAENKKLIFSKSDFGYEISNLDTNGQIICTGEVIIKYSNTWLPTDIMYLANTENNFNFDIEKINKNISFFTYIPEDIFKEFYTDRKPYKCSLNNNTKSFILLYMSGSFYGKPTVYCENNNMVIELPSWTSENKKSEFGFGMSEKQRNIKDMYVTYLKDKNMNTYASSGREGFNGIPWGTTSEELYLLDSVTLYPIGSIELKKFSFEASDGWGKKINPSHTYYLFDNKLYEGQIHYESIDEKKALSIINKLTELYGYADSGSQDKSKIEGVWHKSKTFNISLEVGPFIDALGIQHDSFYLSIIYYNPKMIEEMENTLMQLHNNEIEEEINNLGL